MNLQTHYDLKVARANIKPGELERIKAGRAAQLVRPDEVHTPYCPRRRGHRMRRGDLTTILGGVAASLLPARSNRREFPPSPFVGPDDKPQRERTLALLTSAD
jgi:hypothetical protein